jgi:hypothetical protein
MPPWCTPLMPFDRTLLRYAQRVVPESNRGEWVRHWHAELCHLRSRGPASDSHSLAFGLVLDAVWLRKESWRRSFSGSALLCLTLLALLLPMAALPVLILAGNLKAFATTIESSLPSFAFGSLPIVIVGLLTSRIRVEVRTLPVLGRIKACIFHACKIALLVPLTFLLSVDLFAPLHPFSSFPAFLLQSFAFALLALIAFHWAALDCNLRCKHCLRSLAEPVRVGRPSHNFLEWNGFELLCMEGHGLLSIPEIETSSCSSNRWFPAMLAPSSPAAETLCGKQQS